MNAATVPGSPPAFAQMHRVLKRVPSALASMAATRSTSSWPPGAPPVPACRSYRFYQNTFQRPASAGQRRPGRAGTRAPRLEIHRQPPCTPRRSRCRSSSLLFRLSASPATLLRLGRLYKDRGLKPSQVLNESPSRVIRRQAMIQPLVHSESKPLWPFHSFPFAQSRPGSRNFSSLRYQSLKTKGRYVPKAVSEG